MISWTEAFGDRISRIRISAGEMGFNTRPAASAVRIALYAEALVVIWIFIMGTALVAGIWP